MPLYRYTVEVDTDTVEHANEVIAERIYYDEEYGFDYSINVAARPVEMEGSP